MFKKYRPEEIIAGLLSRDIKTYRYLEREFCPKIIAYVRKNSGTREEGQELYQDTIYKMYVSVEQGKYNPKLGEFGAYFMTIAHRSWIDELRKRSKSFSVIPIDETLEQICNVDEAEQECYYRDVEKLLDCIARLPKKDQEMIHLFYFAKQPLEVIAKKMEITYKYSRIKIGRIRNKLRKMMVSIEYKHQNDLTA